MVARNQRDRLKEQYWREVVSRHATSGMQTGEFCRKESCDQGQFYWWRRELKKREARQKTRRKVEPVGNKIEFLPVRLAGPGNGEGLDKSGAIEIRIVGGIEITVSWGANPILVEALMRGLRIQND